MQLSEGVKVTMIIPSILAVYSTITPQGALNATVITHPLIWIEMHIVAFAF